MKYKSQNNEVEIAIKYFGDRKITILDCGSNDGVTYSNSYDLIQRGNTAYLFEPSTVCSELFRLHSNNPRVHIYNKGLGAKSGKVKFWESENHVKGGKDRALVSTTIESETARWRSLGVKFHENTIEIIDFKGWWDYTGNPKLDLISLDTEGSELSILREIDLKQVGCEMLIVEWNGVIDLKKAFIEYCSQFGLKLKHENSENLIFCLH